MTIPHSLARAARNAVETSAILRDPAALRARNKPQLRRYEISTLLPNNQIAETRHIAPAMPLFEDAFCAFSRGSVIETDMGPIAVEDLLPGDLIQTRDNGLQPLLWKGSTQIVPGRPCPTGREYPLTRFMADCFGMQRPMSYVIAGPSARILATPAHLRHLTGGQDILTPVREFIDGSGIIETSPPTPVQMFHLCLPRHEAINAGGLWFESYHPGPNATRTVSHAMRSIYLGLFAHVDQMCDFGPLRYARAGDGQIDALSA